MASTVPTPRFVRCPKCHKVLAELPGIPLYKCGGCGAILRAKMRSSSGETLSLASAASSSKNISYGGGSPDAETANVEKQTQSASDDPGGHDQEVTQSLNDSGRIGEGNVKEEFSGDGMKAPAVSESNEENLKEKLKSPVYEKNGIRGIALEKDMLRPTGQSDTSKSGVNPLEENQLEQGIPTKTKNSLNEEGKKSSDQEIDQEIAEANDSLKSSDILEESSESLEHSTIPEDNKINGKFRSDNSFLLRSSSHAYDGSLSSTDEERRGHVPQKYLSLSRRTFGKRYVSNSENSIKEAGEDVLKNSANGGAQPLVRKHSKLSFVGISSSITRKVTSTNGDRAREHNVSFASEDFHSAMNWMETENDSPSISQSKDAKLFAKFRYSEKGDQVKILRKVDELRNELLRFFIRGADGKEASRLSITSHFEGKVPPKQYRSSLIPLSKQPNSCFHPHHGGTGCHTCRPCPHNACCHLPEGTTSRPLHMKRSPSLHQEPQNSQSNYKRPQTVKRHCRPVSGGAPFVMCYRCYNLLQLPVDFLVSTKRVHRLRCGLCSEVLRYSFRPRTRSIPRTPAEALHPPSVDENNELLDDEIITQSIDIAGGDPISYSEEFGFSFGMSNSFEAEPSRHFARYDSIVEEEQRGKESSRSQLHKLMGYSSARYLLFETLNAGEGHRTGQDR